MFRYWTTTSLIMTALIGCDSAGDEGLADSTSMVEGDGGVEMQAPPTTDGDLGSPLADMGPTTTDSGPPVGSDEEPFEELFEQGIGRYLGVYSPSAVEARPGGLTNYAFDGRDGGPECYTGERFNMTTRDGAGSELMIFLQGGGFCGPAGCEALERPIPFVQFGILNARDGSNPAADYDVGYVSYCDGTLFSGDRDVDGRSFRGLKNLSASLDVIARSYPDPSKILLIGNSAGGAGTHYALPLVRRLYPEVEIDLLNDSGPGVFGPGGFEATVEYWNSAAFFPASCPSCSSGDNLAEYHAYQLTEDPNMRMGYISSKQDEVIVAELPFDGDTFERELLATIDALSDAHPDRFRSLVADGEQHTFVLSDFDYAIAGTTVRLWITDMLAGSESWVSLSD